MQLPTLALLALSFAPTLSLASTSSKVVCQTKYGSKSVKVVPRSTYTHKFTRTVISKSIVIPKTTVTPKTVTRTAYTDVTTTLTSTAPQTTDTLYVTTIFSTTLTSSSTVTAIITGVESATITADGGTTVVPTSTDFVPVQSVSGNPPSRKRAERIRSEGNARRIEAAEEKSSESNLVERANKGRLQCGFQNGHPYLPSHYPNSVSCKVDIKVVTTKVITSTAHKTITYTAKAPTQTITKTRSHTTSTFATPVHASTTIIISTTTTYSTATTITTTASTVITMTATATAAVATVYPGCGPDNFLSSRNGNPISLVYSGSPNSVAYLSYTTPDAIGCCQICQVDSLCGAFAWASGSCFTLAVRTCTPASIVQQYEGPDGNTEQTYVVGDGNCGQTQWDGY